MVRGLLKKDRHYANYWPAWLELETIFTPLVKFVFVIWSTILRIIDMSMDGIIVLARRTFLREKVVKNRVRRGGLARVMAAEFSEASKPIVSNFTFALMMTCVGIVVILFVIVYTSVL